MYVGLVVLESTTLSFNTIIKLAYTAVNAQLYTVGHKKVRTVLFLPLILLNLN